MQYSTSEYHEIIKKYHGKEGHEATNVEGIAKDLGLPMRPYQGKETTAAFLITSSLLKKRWGDAFPNDDVELRDCEYAIMINTKAHSTTSAKKRERFTIAHEIAHYLLHAKQIKEEGGMLKDDIFYRSWLSNSCEAEANKFAANTILVPEDLLKKAREREQEKFTDDDKLIERLADLFEVSKIAMTIRLGYRA